METKLITAHQLQLLHVLLGQLCSDRNQVKEYKDKIKEHYRVPSTWQLTSQQASKTIDRLQELIDKGAEQQSKLLSKL